MRLDSRLLSSAKSVPWLQLKRINHGRCWIYRYAIEWLLISALVLFAVAELSNRVSAEQAISGGKSVTTSSMLLSVAALRDGNNKELLRKTRRFVASFAGMSFAAFSWHDSRMGAALANVELFPPLQASTGGRQPSALISEALAWKSGGSIQGVDPTDLGYVDHFSAATFDQILFKKLSTTRIEAFKEPGRLVPMGAQSIIDYKLGGLRLLVIRSSSGFDDHIVPGLAAKLARERLLNWKATTVTPLVFHSIVRRTVFPVTLGFADANGRLDNEIYEMAQMTVGQSASFGTVTQVNYYSPGCCWDAVTGTRPDPNAYLFAYSEDNGVMIFSGYGWVTTPG